MEELVPFRWPTEWKEPSKLDLIRDTPINCLVGQEPPPFPLGDLRFIRLGGDLPDGVVIADGVWPQVLPAAEEDAAEAGATGAAWLDSNAMRVRRAQTMNPGKAAWLNYEAPGANEVVPFRRFVKPVAEAQMFGARWIITLNAPFISGLDNGSGDALAAWKQMTAATELFQDHSEWQAWKRVAPLLVVSSFEGSTELLAAEVFNLAPRRHLAHRGLRTSDLAQETFDGVHAVLYVETEPPEGAVREKLVAFAEAGGLVISPQGLASGGTYEVVFKYRVYPLGKGRIAEPPEGWYDPYLLVAETHVLMGRRSDPVRVWNGPDMLCEYFRSPDGDRGVVHLLQYASEPSRPVTIGLAEPYRSARIHAVDSETTVQAVPSELGVEIPIGGISSYIAVELEV